MGHDVDAAVFDMVNRCAGQKRIASMLANLEENELISTARHKELLRLVLANLNAVVDTDVLLMMLPGHRRKT